MQAIVISERGVNCWITGKIKLVDSAVKFLEKKHKLSVSLYETTEGSDDAWQVRIYEMHEVSARLMYQKLVKYMDVSLRHRLNTLDDISQRNTVRQSHYAQLTNLLYHRNKNKYLVNLLNKHMGSESIKWVYKKGKIYEIRKGYSTLYRVTFTDTVVDKIKRLVTKENNENGAIRLVQTVTGCSKVDAQVFVNSVCKRSLIVGQTSS